MDDRAAPATLARQKPESSDSAAAALPGWTGQSGPPPGQAQAPSRRDSSWLIVRSGLDECPGPTSGRTTGGAERGGAAGSVLCCERPSTGNQERWDEEEASVTNVAHHFRKPGRLSGDAPIAAYMYSSYLSTDRPRLPDLVSSMKVLHSRYTQLEIWKCRRHSTGSLK